MAQDDTTRDRVRALVRDVLNNALPAEDEPTSGSGEETASVTATKPAPAVAASTAGTTTPPPSGRFINIAPETGTASQTPPAFTHDESSKTVITETDVHDLAEGSRLRIAEGARLTPLAADIVRERKIELVRRVPRRGSRAAKMIAVGADHGGYRMKEELKTLLAELGHRVRDFG
ncbi:MAG TPA: hypothetical protein VGC64_08035, partial [Pyrinomonadaceae bacterium]